MTPRPPLDVVHHAYRRLAHDELVLFLKVRNLPTSGSDADLASRLTHHDLHTYHFPTNAPTTTPTTSLLSTAAAAVCTHHHHNGTDGSSDTRKRPTPDLPIELIIDIIDRVGDWELAQALQLPTSLPRPLEWSRASSSDHALLPGTLPPHITLTLTTHPPTKIGAAAIVRFAYVPTLTYLLTHHPHLFPALFAHDLVPIKASRHGRIAVLDWWRRALDTHPHLVPMPQPGSIRDAVDGASRNGHVASLDWWFAHSTTAPPGPTTTPTPSSPSSPSHSHHRRPFTFDYTDAALEYASARNHIAVLDWWKHQHTAHALPLRIGRVMDMASTAGHVAVLEWWAASTLEPKYDRHAMLSASCHGKVPVLDWWLGSGLQLVFDADALTGASRYNRPEVLEWWDRSGLPIQYRICDIEEALEEAIGGGELAKAWWKKKGVDFTANHREWTKLQNLN